MTQEVLLLPELPLCGDYLYSALLDFCIETSTYVSRRYLIDDVYVHNESSNREREDGETSVCGRFKNKRARDTCTCKVDNIRWINIIKARRER